MGARPVRQRGEAQEPALNRIGKAVPGLCHLGKRQWLSAGFPDDAHCLAVLSSGGQTKALALRMQASEGAVWLGICVWWPSAGSAVENRSRGAWCGWDAWWWRRRGAWQ